MALSTGIPTSFVPKQPVQPVANRPMRAGNNLFLIVSLALAGFVAVVALGVFGYGKYLDHTLATKEAKLSAAQANVDESTIEDFIRLRDRLSSGETLLTNHVELSQFFNVLESLTLQNVRFSSLKLVIAGDHTATIDLMGTAKNFNTLAAQSNSFATEKRIKRAIFSAITLTPEKAVGFRLTADIDPKLIVAGSVQSGAAVPAALQTNTPVPAASSTPTVGSLTGTTTPAKPVVHTASSSTPQ